MKGTLNQGKKIKNYFVNIGKIISLSLTISKKIINEAMYAYKCIQKIYQQRLRNTAELEHTKEEKTKN